MTDFSAIRPLAAAALILALAACESEDEKMADLLVGSWTCQAQSPETAEMPAMTLKSDAQYMRNKKSSGLMVMSFALDGTPVDLEMLISGTWNIDDGNLVEEITKLTIMNIRAGGTSYALTDLTPEGQNLFAMIRDAMQDSAGMSEIRELTETRLEVFEPISRLAVNCRAL